MDPIAQTARWTAASRARESRRPDRLFEDPWAALLAGEEGQAEFDVGATVDSDASFIPLRTKYYDDVILTATRAGLHQVVLLAAGLDTRPYRLDLAPTTVVFELDRPQVLQLKRRVLAEAGAQTSCPQHSVAVDLTEAWQDALEGAGFRREQPSLWVAEGFLGYLEEAQVRGVLRQVTALAAPGSQLAVDVTSVAMLRSEWTRAFIEMMERRGSPWRFACDEPEALLADFGWDARVIELGQDGTGHGRWPFPAHPRTRRDIPRTFLVTATRAA